MLKSGFLCLQNRFLSPGDGCKERVTFGQYVEMVYINIEQEYENPCNCMCVCKAKLRRGNTQHSSAQSTQPTGQRAKFWKVPRLSAYGSTPCSQPLKYCWSYEDARGQPKVSAIATVVTDIVEVVLAATALVRDGGGRRNSHAWVPTVVVAHRQQNVPAVLLEK
jgi:hypothetical protein